MTMVGKAMLLTMAAAVSLSRAFTFPSQRNITRYFFVLYVTGGITVAKVQAEAFSGVIRTRPLVSTSQFDRSRPIDTRWAIQPFREVYAYNICNVSFRRR